MRAPLVQVRAWVESGQSFGPSGVQAHRPFEQQRGVAAHAACTAHVPPALHFSRRRTVQAAESVRAHTQFGVAVARHRGVAPVHAGCIWNAPAIADVGGYPDACDGPLGATRRPCRWTGSQPSRRSRSPPRRLTRRRRSTRRRRWHRRTRPQSPTRRWTRRPPRHRPLSRPSAVDPATPPAAEPATPPEPPAPSARPPFPPAAPATPPVAASFGRTDAEPQLLRNPASNHTK